jgi:hypothetical protein
MTNKQLLRFQEIEEGYIYERRGKPEGLPLFTL